MNGNDTDERVMVSYLTLRRVIGVLGVLLPFLVASGCFLIGSCTELQSSISAYYGTDMRDVFVGILFVIAWFLFAYRGHERADDIAGDLACVFALGVALFPTTSETAWIRHAHTIAAALLFLVLSYFSIVLFRKTSGNPTAEKLFRNRIYMACGVTMLVCIAAMAVYNLFLTGTAVAELKPIFWLEAIALTAFGFSWFVKGDTLWRDTVAD